MTIDQIFDEALFVESWRNQSNYTGYFSACSPRSLSFSFHRRFDFRTISYVSSSAFSGLVVLLKLFTPFCIKIYRWIRRTRTIVSTQIQTGYSLPGHPFQAP